MPIRDDRLTWPIAGHGGFLEFFWPSGRADPGGTKPDPSGANPEHTAESIHPNNDYAERLEVQEWTVQPAYRYLEVAGSGNFGSIMRRRVVADFKWTANIDLDLRPVRDGSPANNANPQPYFEGRLEGNMHDHFQIAMRFQVGDPSLEVPCEDTPLVGMFYFCPHVMLDDVLLRNPVKDRGVVRCVVRGSGSAPLQRWVDGVQTGGAGGFGFTEAELMSGRDFLHA